MEDGERVQKNISLTAFVLIALSEAKGVTGVGKTLFIIKLSNIKYHIVKYIPTFHSNIQIHVPVQSRPFLFIGLCLYFRLLVPLLMLLKLQPWVTLRGIYIPSQMCSKRHW